MTAEYPIKFRVLELFNDGKDHWNSEIVKTIMKEYGITSNFGRDSINFDLIELAAGGMIKEIDVKLDDGSYKKDALLHKYAITEFGKVRQKDTCVM